MIQVLFNTLPQAEVKAKVENQIVVTSNMWGKNEKDNFFISDFHNN
jgi:hypothetical protein